MTGARHWAEAWLGRPWVAGEHDCADFVVAVLREQFGSLGLTVAVDGSRLELGSADGIRGGFVSIHLPGG